MSASLAAINGDSRRRRRWSVTARAVAFLGIVHAGAAHACVGDCNGDGVVQIGELLVGVNIVLGLQSVSHCMAFVDADDHVDVGQLVQGVNGALNGCSGSTVTLTGICEAPGAGTRGLAPCTLGTPISVFRCDDRSQCLHEQGSAIAATTVTSGGAWSLEVSVAAASAALVFHADIDQAVIYRTVRLGNAGALRDVRRIGFAAARDADTAGVVIDPNSEGATRVIDGLGFETVSDGQFDNLDQQTRADPRADYTGLTAAEGANHAALIASVLLSLDNGGIQDFATSIASGPDGNLWVSGLEGLPIDVGNGGFYRLSEVARITPSGVATIFDLPKDHAYIDVGSDITGGPDGNLWLSGLAGPPIDVGDGGFYYLYEIARITPNGEVTTFDLPRDHLFPPGRGTGIASGPDGNLWVCGLDGPPIDVGDGGFYRLSEVVRITPGGQASIVELPNGHSYLDMGSDITSGPDGNLWVSGVAGPVVDLGEGTFYYPFEVARITPSGLVTTFELPKDHLYERSTAITSGPDGNLWVAGLAGPPIDVGDGGFYRLAEVARITPSGGVTIIALPKDHLSLTGGASITSGPDSNLWVSGLEGPPIDVGNGGFYRLSEVARITPSGEVTTYPLPNGNFYIAGSGITAGTDGNLWVSGLASSVCHVDACDYNGGIARITPP